jgi:hypothetical protein
MTYTQTNSELKALKISAIDMVCQHSLRVCIVSWTVCLAYRGRRFIFVANLADWEVLNRLCVKKSEVLCRTEHLSLE